MTKEKFCIFQSFAIHRVEGVHQIHGDRVEVDLHLPTLLLQLAGGDDNVGGFPMTAEAALTLRQETLFQMVVQAVEKAASEDYPVEQGGASVVVAYLAVPFALIEVDDRGIIEVLRDFSLTPPLLGGHRQVVHELGATVLVDLSRDRVQSGRFPTRKLPHGPYGFVKRGREVDVGGGLHLRQRGDDSYGDSGRTVEDASEALGPSL
ncbi:hypothetical protein SprV_0301105900 [Sparganum proliferum]